MRPVPVLMYHHINNHKGDMVTVTPEIFEKQMRYLHKSGYKTLKTGELLSYIKGDLFLKEKAVLITFDDGWLDNYIFAYPVLKKYGLNSAIFIVASWIDEASINKPSVHAYIPTHEESVLLIKQNQGSKVVLNWDLIREMEDSGLVEIHSHTQNHLKCHHLSENDLSKELHESKDLIENRLGRECLCLCWPFGRYNDLAIKTAGEIGYKALFTTKHGLVNKKTDPFAIPRIAAKDSISWFKKIINIYANTLLSGLYLRLIRK